MRGGSVPDHRLTRGRRGVQALQLASKVDPSHSRTIGVLTKIDLMDRGTNATDILNNKKYPLKLGWVGVVNRSQQDIEGRKTLADAKNAEKDYFHAPESPYRCALACCSMAAKSTCSSVFLIAIALALLCSIRASAGACCACS